MLKIRRALPLFLSLMLVGCSGFVDASIVISDRGPDYVYPFESHRRDKVLEDEGVSRNKNLIGIFVDAYRTSVALPINNDRAYAMAVTGYDLVDHYCQQFFQSGGENQKWLGLSKDLVAAAGTVATGIVGLASKANATTAAMIALGTATAYNGIDIYTRNFLFGADNITSVRTLTLNALTAHRQATLAKQPSAPWTFGAATLQIEDHQALCQSAKIRELVLQAIKGGTVKAFTPSGQLITAAGVAPETKSTTPPATTDPTVHVEVKASGS